MREKRGREDECKRFEDMCGGAGMQRTKRKEEVCRREVSMRDPVPCEHREVA